MRRILGAVFLVLFICNLNAAAEDLIPFPPSGEATWGDWSFHWLVGDKAEGLVLKEVRFKGVLVIHKASMPVIRVKYRGDNGDDGIGDGCGPYLDQIEWKHIKFLPGSPTKVVGRIFDDTILEIAIFAEIGSYDLYQAWNFHMSGRLQPMLYSSGWSCGHDQHENDHKHHPYWRIDFDVEGAQNEIWQTRPFGGSSTLTVSSRQALEDNSARQSQSEQVSWTINRPGSNKHVLVRYPDNQLRDQSGRPWFAFSNKDAAWRRYKVGENVGWEFDWDQHLGYRVPAENTNGKDIVFWAVGHLFHEWSQSDENNPQWHATGPIIDVVNF